MGRVFPQSRELHDLVAEQFGRDQRDPLRVGRHGELLAGGTAGPR
jgi:hypothetical protein